VVLKKVAGEDCMIWSFITCTRQEILLG